MKYIIHIIKYLILLRAFLIWMLPVLPAATLYEYGYFKQAYEKALTSAENGNAKDQVKSMKLFNEAGNQLLLDNNISDFDNGTTFEYRMADIFSDYQYAKTMKIKSNTLEKIYSTQELAMAKKMSDKIVDTCWK